MYLPDRFRVEDHALLHELMRQFGFALPVSVHEGLPFVLDAERKRLEAHMARANPQWTSLEANPEVLRATTATSLPPGTTSPCTPTARRGSRASWQGTAHEPLQPCAAMTSSCPRWLRSCPAHKRTSRRRLSHSSRSG